MGEAERPRESGPEELSRLVKQLRVLETGYWGLEDDSERMKVDYEVDQICSRLVELGVDLEKLAKAERGIEE